jgi:hypothetical protein
MKMVAASKMKQDVGRLERAKHFGGSMTIKLDRGQKLVDVTWKESSLWYMTKPMREGDEAETYSFKEDSSYGIMQGTVIFVETK